MWLPSGRSFPEHVGILRQQRRVMQLTKVMALEWAKYNIR